MFQDKLNVFCCPFYLTFSNRPQVYKIMILKGVVGKSSYFHNTWYLHDVVVEKRRQRNACMCNQFLGTILCRRCATRRETFLISHFVKNVNARRRFSCSCSELGYSPLERNSRKNLEKMRKLSNLPKNWRCFNFITILHSI